MYTYIYTHIYIYISQDICPSFFSSLFSETKRGKRKKLIEGRAVLPVTTCRHSRVWQEMAGKIFAGDQVMSVCVCE